MVQRVNISIQDDLHQRLQAIKDQINVSAVCADALTQAVQFQEIINQAQEGKEKMIARLRKEREEAANTWFQAGRQEGLEAAEHESYENFLLISEAFELSNSGELWSEDLWNNSEFEWISERAEYCEVPEGLRSDFYRGIFEALLDQWLEVKNEVME